MGSIRKIAAAMLIGLAFAAFQSDADAQTRRSSSDSQRSSSKSVSRSSSQTARKSSDTGRKAVTRPSSDNKSNPSSNVRRPSTNASRPSTARPSSVTRPTTTRPSSADRPSDQSKVSRPTTTRPSSVARPAGQTANRPEFRPGNQNKPIQVTRPAPRKPSSGPAAGRPSVQPGKSPGHKPSKPVQIRPDHRYDRHRVHPRDRDFMRWNKPSYFWTGHNHYYGHRVRTLPARVVMHNYYGLTYYCYNNIWYRPYGGHYIVCRPPYGTALAANIMADIAWVAVRMSYYNTMANTYSQINANNAYIAEQNAIIAQNNATIASQNSIIAQTQPMAYASYTLANSLGLIQSYAAAGTDYFYQDGVFYSMDPTGQYRVIIPPAGALVDTLPEDYDIVTLNDGKDYYKVDDTVYRVVISEGRPAFEVLGQLY